MFASCSHLRYYNGAHGTSDKKGDQSVEDYGNDVTGGNTVTPDKGYKFTGKYKYVIKDKYGNVIERGTVDEKDIKDMKVTGNIDFTPIYEKVSNDEPDSNGNDNKKQPGNSTKKNPSTLPKGTPITGDTDIVLYIMVFASALMNLIGLAILKRSIR